MADLTQTPEEDSFIRAGEYALGVLEGEELASARRSMLSDPAFAQAVEWWEYRLGSMGEAAGTMAPSPSVWNGIVARIDAIEATHDDRPTPLSRNRPSSWSIAALTAGLGMAVAGLVFYIATPRTVVLPEQPPVTAPLGSQLVAQLQGEDGERRLAGVIDIDNNRLALSIAGLDAEIGKTPELWVIPAGGAPVSLGAIPQTGSFGRELSGEEAALLVSGSTLAVTFEDDTGLRHEAPTLPIVLAGTLDQV